MSFIELKNIVFTCLVFQEKTVLAVIPESHFIQLTHGVHYSRHLCTSF